MIIDRFRLEFYCHRCCCYRWWSKSFSMHIYFFFLTINLLIWFVRYDIFALIFVEMKRNKEKWMETIFFSSPLWVDILIVYLCIRNSDEYTHKNVKYESSCREYLLCIHPLIARKNIFPSSFKQIISRCSWLLQKSERVGENKRMERRSQRGRERERGKMWLLLLVTRMCINLWQYFSILDQCSFVHLNEKHFFHPLIIEVYSSRSWVSLSLSLSLFFSSFSSIINV